MTLRRTVVLLTALAAAFGMTTGAAAAPPEPDQGARRVLDLSGADGVGGVSGSKFTAVSPVRVLDTRTGLGVPSAPVPAGGTITVDLSARVPEGTTAVMLNLTGVAPTSGTYVAVWPAESPRPTVSNLNLAAGETRANAVTVALGASRSLSMFNNAGSIDLVADLSGYYSPEGEAWHNTSSQRRLLDTRESASPIPAGGTITVDTSSPLPFTGAVAVTVNLTVVNPTATTYVTAFPEGVPRPTASSVNATRGTVTANQVTVRFVGGGNIKLYNHTGNAHVTVDMVAWYDTSEFMGSLFYPATPTRVVDTRTDGGGPLRGGRSYPVVVAEDPADAHISAMVLNVTGIDGTTSTYLTLYPSGSAAPAASTINLAAGQTASNLATTALGWGSDDDYGFTIYNKSGDIHVALDVAGYFVLDTA